MGVGGNNNPINLLCWLWKSVFPPSQSYTRLFSSTSLIFNLFWCTVGQIYPPWCLCDAGIKNIYLPRPVPASPPECANHRFHWEVLQVLRRQPKSNQIFSSEVKDEASGGWVEFRGLYSVYSHSIVMGRSWLTWDIIDASLSLPLHTPLVWFFFYLQKLTEALKKQKVCSKVRLCPFM